jgi:hypothetical protein
MPEGGAAAKCARLSSKLLTADQSTPYLRDPPARVHGNRHLTCRPGPNGGGLR